MCDRSSDPTQHAYYHERVRLCAECGHHLNHHVRLEPAPHDCADCDDLAQLGQYAPCAHALPDIPPGATFEPWSDADDAELAREMAAAAEHIRDRYSESRAGAEVMRRNPSYFAHTIAVVTAGVREHTRERDEQAH